MLAKLKMLCEYVNGLGCASETKPSCSSRFRAALIGVLLIPRTEEKLRSATKDPGGRADSWICRLISSYAWSLSSERRDFVTDWTMVESPGVESRCVERWWPAGGPSMTEISVFHKLTPHSGPRLSGARPGHTWAAESFAFAARLGTFLALSSLQQRLPGSTHRCVL